MRTLRSALSLQILGFFCACGGTTPPPQSASQEADDPGDPVSAPAAEPVSAPESASAASVEVPPRAWTIEEPERSEPPSFSSLAAIPGANDRRPLVDFRPRLRAFQNRAQLRRFASGQQRRTAMAPRVGGGGAPTSISALGSSSGSSPTASPSTSSSASNTGVTTTQIAGIDEGDIVKAMGKHILVLRRGMLYAVDAETLTVTGRVGVMEDEEADGWIDELLVHEAARRAVVVGFVQGPDDRAYTLMHLFNIDDQGAIDRGDAIWLRSEDYFSDENYATRLLGNDLLLYTMHSLQLEEQFEPEDFEGMEAEEIAAMRALNRWDATLPAIRNERGRFEATWSPRRIFKRARSRARVLHAVTRCDLSRTPVPCSTQGVIEDGYARLFVSPTAAYLWVDDASLLPTPGDDASDAEWEAYDEREQDFESVSAVYRFPHARARQRQRAVKVAMTRGTLASMMHLAEFDGHLHALVGWPEEVNEGTEEPVDDEVTSEAALLRINLRNFGARMSRADVRRLPSEMPEAGRWSGRRVVYGAGDQAVVHDASTSQTWSASVGRAPARVDPIEGGVLVTLRGDGVEYLSVDLQSAPRAHEQRRLVGASGAETRTHGFFFLPRAPGTGTFGVPIVRSSGRQDAGRAAIAFFDMDGFQTTLAGTIFSNGTEVPCTQSCVDWYGNARPVFWGGRIFALMGSEFVAAERREGELVEAGRTVLQ
ncbi:MAG: beta-propeller domain-containing protein [Myxococcota bacterium]